MLEVKTKRRPDDAPVLMGRADDAADFASRRREAGRDPSGSGRGAAAAGQERPARTLQATAFDRRERRATSPVQKAGRRAAQAFTPTGRTRRAAEPGRVRQLGE